MAYSYSATAAVVPFCALRLQAAFRPRVTALDPSRQETYHTQPSFLPDGLHFLYFRQTGAAEHVGVYLGSLDAKPAEQASRSENSGWRRLP